MMSSFCTCVPKIMTIRCMLPDIWSARDIIFCHFGPFFALLPHYWLRKLKFGKNIKKIWRYFPFSHVHHKWCIMYGSWDIRHDVQSFSSFSTIFCPLTLVTIRETKNEKSTWRYYHLLHLCTTNGNHMMHGSWQTKFFVIFDHFLAFYLPKKPKNQNFEKMTKLTRRYCHFTLVYQKSWSYALMFLIYGMWRM